MNSRFHGLILLFHNLILLFRGLFYFFRMVSGGLGLALEGLVQASRSFGSALVTLGLAFAGLGGWLLLSIRALAWCGGPLGFAGAVVGGALGGCEGGWTG